MTAIPSAPTVRPLDTPADGEGRPWGLMAEFDSPAAIMSAAKKVNAEGFRWWDCHVPFPVHGLDTAMGIRPTILPIFVFLGGLTGTTLGFLLQWFTNASSFDFWMLVPVRGFDYLVSGKPLLSLPAWIPVMFELTILLASLTAFGVLMIMNGLPRFYHPTLRCPRFARATDDRFFVVIEARDPRYHVMQTRAFLDSLNPLSIEILVD